MAVIAVVGTSGIGKSLLVRQLAAFYNAPAFFEGEEGTIPHDVLNSVFKSKSPEKRWRWFLNRDKIRFEKAHKISSQGIDCFTDGGVITSRAILPYEDKKYHATLSRMIDEIASLEADLIILLRADKKKISEFIKLRDRKSENNSAAIKRALFIQDEFKKIARKMRTVLVVDRTKMDFYSPDHLSTIAKRLDKALLAKAKPL